MFSAIAKCNRAVMPDDLADKVRPMRITPRPVISSAAPTETQSVPAPRSSNRHFAPLNFMRPHSLPTLDQIPRDKPPPRIAINVKPGRLQFSEDKKEYTVEAADLVEDCIIGSGNYGTVYRMAHQESGQLMAVKRIRATSMNEKEQKRMLIELETVKRAQSCDHIIRFFGALFTEGDCWICMELMDLSLEKLYKTAFLIGTPLSEAFVGHVTVCTVSALSFLKDHLKIIHRDVKPSNIVLNQHGAVKLVDFGVAGHLVNSCATSDVGCISYMAPERISQTTDIRKYDIRSDVWSLGITLAEISLGHLPYKDYKSPFHQMEEVVDGPAPLLTLDKLPADYDQAFIIFVNGCLTKDKLSRPNFHGLEASTFYKQYEWMMNDEDSLRTFGAFVGHIIKNVKTDSASLLTCDGGISHLA